ncbi:hypothetical protein [Sphingomonas sanguinis]|uniref:Uncharacterized protein n=1 Tax=Sphingomonas sanguinis TaxID=33051 RepID=A0A147HTM0_9SPHN|nr:hypothetical protein [Sphingomonas sanguinis]KTT68248.1 hypothetical protein NS319_14775 [Sphingomonas sanguinis]
MSEQIYDDIVAPMLLEVMKVCHEHGMPIVATVEYAPGDFGTSADLPANRSLPMDWSYVGARSNGNADVLIGHLVDQAKKRGHGSVFLKQLGVPTNPASVGDPA